jgi:hypothetical protein
MRLGMGLSFLLGVALSARRDHAEPDANLNAAAPDRPPAGRR